MNLKKFPLTRLMTREGLTSLRQGALRRRVWFKVLTKLERSVMELTIRCVDQVRSGRLALVIGRIACKLLKTWRSWFLKRVNSIGYQLAARMSHIAVSWGYLEASDWQRDARFIRYLGVNAVNTPSGWGFAFSS